ncbi:TolC family protein [Pedobacter alpinus]|uniref:TolC family protein n=1 Tax=Pedobacter alpinus TaxID=1590643 RepID=A0ABW5TTR0_9SPHI
MKTIRVLLTAVLMLSFASLWAQTETPKAYNFNLEQCINYAYEHQTALLNAGIDQKIADAKVKETIGIGLPQINGTADLRDFLKIPVSLVPAEIFGGTAGTFQPVQFGVKYNSSVGVSVNQLLFSGSYIVGLQASKTFKELSQRAYNRSKIETNVAVKKAFYMVLVNNKRVELLDANISQLKAQLDQTQALFDNGFAEKIDADRLKVLFNNLTTEKTNVLRSLELGKAMLKFQMGMPVENELTLNGSIEAIKLDEVDLMADSSTYKNRIEYNLAETQLKLNQLDLKRYKSEYLPSLAAFGNSSLQYQNNSFADLYDRSFPTTVIGLQLNVPIFSGGQRLQKVKQAQFTVLKSNNDLYNAKNAINLDIKNSITTYKNSVTSLESQQKNLDLASEVLRVTKIKYEQGVGSSIEVTQAQTSLKEAENNYINALYDALISKVDTEKATGLIK